jgi:NADH dehydrogenase (ubiquinone) 1 alpha subcomplex subunit 9
VAQALAGFMRRPPLPGTLSLPGPSTLTFQYLLDLVESIAINPPSRAPVLPKAVALALTKLSQSLWWPTLCPDEVERRYIDDVDVTGDWGAVGVIPSEIESHALTYLRRYRSAFVFLFYLVDGIPLIDVNRENFVRPVVFPPRTVRMPSPLSTLNSPP